MSVKVYPVTPEMDERLQNTFRYHQPLPGQAERLLLIRENAKDLARLILELSPGSREQSLALTNLEQAVFWANAGIVRNEKPEVVNPAPAPPERKWEWVITLACRLRTRSFVLLDDGQVRQVEEVSPDGTAGTLVKFFCSRAESYANTFEFKVLPNYQPEPTEPPAVS